MMTMPFTTTDVNSVLCGLGTDDLMRTLAPSSGFVERLPFSPASRTPVVVGRPKCDCTAVRWRLHPQAICWVHFRWRHDVPPNHRSVHQLPWYHLQWGQRHSRPPRVNTIAFAKGKCGNGRQKNAKRRKE
ncbi:hypothetical protein MTO96_023219 [Rhipicephalus appendiculatus]